MRDQIEAGHLEPHVSILSERALSERYEVSRMTARHAVETLMLEGYVYRSPRRGTFVAEPRLRFSVGSFTRIMSETDHLPGTEVLSASTLDPDAPYLRDPRRSGRRPGPPSSATAHGERRACGHREHPSLCRAIPGSAGT